MPSLHICRGALKLAAAPKPSALPTSCCPASVLTVPGSAAQALATHVSPIVHALPSSHGRPVLVCWQVPVASQLSVVQLLASSQFLTVLLQVPVVQASTVHALPSLQFLAMWPHVALIGSQTSSVQALLSSQFLPVPLHAPLVHASLAVQASLSLQLVPLVTAVKVQPLTGSQASVVQALPSSQETVGKVMSRRRLLPESATMPLPSCRKRIACKPLNLATVASPSTKPAVLPSAVATAVPVTNRRRWLPVSAT